MTAIVMALSIVSASFDTFRMSKRFAKAFQQKTSLLFFNCAERERKDWDVRGGEGQNSTEKNTLRKIQTPPPPPTRSKKKVRILVSV